MNEKDKRRIELFNKGYSIKEIAKLENVTNSCIALSLNRNGIVVRRKNNNSEEIYNEFKSGKTLKELAEKYNTNQNNIKFHIKKFEDISFKRSYKDNKEREKLVLDLYNQGYSLFKISMMSKTESSIVKKLLKDNGIIYKNKAQFRKRIIDENIFETIDTQEKAYWLGMLYADGYVSAYHKKGDKNVVELCLKDKEHIQKFIEFLGDKEYKPEKKINNLKGQEFVNWRYYVSSKKLVSDLIDKGCVEKKSLVLKFPTRDILKEELIPHFIRGYFDGDGSCDANKNMYISMIGTENFLDEVINILLKNKLITTKPKYQMEGNAYSFNKGGKNQVKKIVNFLYPKDTTIYLERKRDKIAVLLGEE